MGPWLDSPVLLAVPIGVAFGALLERGGLASSRTIADQLALRDFTVAKVMLITIVTAMLGVFWASRLGWLNLAQVGMPSTDLLPQAFGATVFGAGFALASLCPGTACAAVGTGRSDGLAVVGGLFVGTLAITLAWPDLGVIAEQANREGATIAGDLGLPTGVVVAGFTVAALAVLPWFSRWEGDLRPGRILKTPWGAAAVVLAALAIPASTSVSGGTTDELEAIAREISAEADHVEPLELADWIRERRAGLRVIDVRPVLSDNDYVIPGAERIPLNLLLRTEIRGEELVVIYSEGGNHAEQAWVLLRTQGVRNALVLHGGLSGWEDEVLAPLPAIPGDSFDAARFGRARSASQYFGGIPRTTREGAGTEDSGKPRRRNRC